MHASDACLFAWCSCRSCRPTAPMRPTKRQEKRRRRTSSSSSPTTWATATWAATAIRRSPRRTSTAWPREGLRLTQFYVGRMRLHAQPRGAADRAAADPQRHVQRQAARAVFRFDRRPARRAKSRSPRRSRRRTTRRPASASGTWATCRSFCPRGTASTRTTAFPTATT